ncbi:MAG TPA: hypothetical protein DGT23_19810 [Micromonosporaceae bacterium]|nr:hypothetical protein [Micromonosporaceae bacterium]
MIPFATQAEFEAWLSEHHETETEVWIKYAKKGTGIPTITYAEALDVALCYGWIDGQSKGLDEQYFMQRYTPRTKRSKWSKINCGKATALIEAGKMRPAGLRQVELAKADGRWDAAYASPANATVPEDLQQALDANPDAAAFFATLDGRNRYAILHRTHDAKKPENRARRIDKFVTMLANKEKIYP